MKTLHNKIKSLAENFYKDTVEIVLQNNVNVNANSKNGRTALIWTVFIDSHIDTVKLLLDNAADIDAKDNEGKQLWIGLEKDAKMTLLTC